MDVAAASAEMSQSQVQQEASMKIASMSQDQTEQAGEELTKLMDESLEGAQEVDNSSHPHKGQAVDFLA